MTSDRGRGGVVRAASRRLISGTVSGIIPGSAGGGWPGLTGGGAWVLVRSSSRAAVTAQMARAAMTSTAHPLGFVPAARPGEISELADMVDLQAHCALA